MDEFWDKIVEPPKSFSPVPFWWWSGDKLYSGRIRYQMEKMVEGGIYNAVIINLAPNGPLWSSDEDVPHFLDEDWWQIFEETLVFADKLGIKIWFYDQLGFSGANFQESIIGKHPEFSAESIDSICIEGVGKLSVELPEDSRFIAAFDISEDPQNSDNQKINKVVITKKIVAGYSKNKHKLRLIFSTKSGFDYFSKDACRQLLKPFHENIESRVKKYLGNVIVGSFQDELPAMPNWSLDFADKFKSIKGYDICERIHYLFDGDSPDACKTRVDYQDVRAILCENAFFKPLHEWHLKNGLLCGFDQIAAARAGDPIHTTLFYADYMKTHKWYDIPGNDHTGSTQIHSALAKTYNKKRVWLEAFHSTGWGGTIEETVDWLIPWFRAGANLYNPHAFYYSTKAGRWEWAAPSTCWRQPYWKHYKYFADAISRICYVLSQGQHVCDSAVFYPKTAIQASIKLGMNLNEPDDFSSNIKKVYYDVIGTENWFQYSEGILDKANVDFEIINEDLIGTGNYKVIILPYCRFLSEESATALCKFADNGGLILAIGIKPELITNSTISSGFDRLFSSGKALLLESVGELEKILVSYPKTIEAPVRTMHRVYNDLNILFVPAISGRATEIINRSDSFDVEYDFDPERYFRKMTIRIKDVEQNICMLDILSGDIIELDHTLTNGTAEITIPFLKFPAAVIFWARQRIRSGGKYSGSSLIDMAKTKNCLILNDWKYSVKFTMDNTYGDFDLPPYEGSPGIETWRFRYIDSLNEGKCFDTIATYGPKALYRKLSSDEAILTGISSVPEVINGVPSDWKILEFSYTRGTEKNVSYCLGPKGRIPEEFMVFEPVNPGDKIHIKTSFMSEMTQQLSLIVGANSNKEAWLNGLKVLDDNDLYLAVSDVSLSTGLNILDICLTADNNEMIKGYFCFTSDKEGFARPEWMTIPGSVFRNEVYSFTKTFELFDIPTQSEISLAVDTDCVISINGEHIGCYKDLERYNYLVKGKCKHFNVRNLHRGTNQIVIKVCIKGKTDSENSFSLISGIEGKSEGQKVHVYFDMVVGSDAGNNVSVVSGGDWLLNSEQSGESSDNTFAQIIKSAKLSSLNSFDPSFYSIKKKPHPLPGSAWLEGEQNSGVLDIKYDAWFNVKHTETFIWKIPSIAHEVILDVNGSCELMIDDHVVDVTDGRAILPYSQKPYYNAHLLVTPGSGFSGGAVFNRPVRYDLKDEGNIQLGDWGSYGLDSFSGCVVYRMDFWISDTKINHAKAVLDLGKIRGTVEVWINGETAGTLILSPYRLDIDRFIRPGVNKIEVSVYNTLAPYISSVSPAALVLKGQNVSGMFGPVKIEFQESPAPKEHFGANHYMQENCQKGNKGGKEWYEY